MSSKERTWRGLAPQWLAAISIICVGASSVHPDQQSDVTRVAYRVDSDVSPDFRQQAREATKTIPASVWNGLLKNGWRVRVAKFVVDAAPSLRGAQPRGWPSDMTWEHTDAVHVLWPFSHNPRQARDKGLILGVFPRTPSWLCVHLDLKSSGDISGDISGDSESDSIQCPDKLPHRIPTSNAYKSL